ncbi:3-phosphoshikimate 1-carboxyvinyltransferase [Chromatiales bacterium (ex Bugula neritina AB1)]|nr:3-phosphoshikimate 1-carboxyvinyltransferase [Chromatiales bacterium (ex Bugula neritina AB1)]
MTPSNSVTAGPGGSVNGEAVVPGDKSMSHRSVMFASLAEGRTSIKGFLAGEDSLNTLAAFQAMGVSIERTSQTGLIIDGVGMHGLKAPSESLYMGNAGTGMRLIAGVLAGQKFSTQLTGDESLSKRPMRRIIDPLREMGAVIDSQQSGCPPLVIDPANALAAISYQLPMASAQVKSCVLLAGLYARGRTSVTEPASTRDHTERMLRTFGYPVETDGAEVSLQGQGKLSSTELEIPADISSAAFLLVAASIAPDSDVLLKNVGVNPTRTGVIDILKLMGADIELQNRRDAGAEPVADIRVRTANLKGIAIPESLVPLAIDELPVIFIAAACAEGTTTVTGAEELRVKESDRIAAMAEGLASLGVDAVATADGMIINGGTIGGGTVETFYDHRIAMSFCVASLCATDPITIRDTHHVETSFPGFFEQCADLGMVIKRQSLDG